MIVYYCRKDLRKLREKIKISDKKYKLKELEVFKIKNKDGENIRQQGF